MYFFRTGSTFVSNLLSSYADSFYMSEPFYHLRYNGHFVNDLSHWDESIPSYVAYNLTKLFECDEV